MGVCPEVWIQIGTSVSRLSLVWTMALALMVFAAACDDEGEFPADEPLRSLTLPR